ncbi:ATP-binding protein [Serratia ureilytica]|uniref:ATP-binding protein n=1 Tax=Serratia ureilytica TaxID=300181 RepID=UPI00313E152E
MLTVHLNAQRKGIALSVKVREEVFTRISMSRLRLRQILLNLLGNTVKFTERGIISVCVSYGDNQLVIVVEDSGPGNPLKKFGDVFQPFIQINVHSGGNGMGLKIAKMLACMMGREIALSSRVGVGSCFTLRLPLKDPQDMLSFQRCQSTALFASHLCRLGEQADRRKKPTVGITQTDIFAGVPAPATVSYTLST